MAATAEKEIDLLELLRLFYRRKRVIALVTFIGAAFGLAVSLLSTPIYQADALLQLEEKSTGSMALSPDLSELFSSTSLAATEIEILRSRMILTPVIESLGLEVSATPKRLPVVGNFLSRFDIPDPGLSFLRSYAWHDESISVSRLELPEELLDTDILLTCLGDGHYEIELPAGAPLLGQVNRTYRNSTMGLQLMVSQMHCAPGRQFVLRKTNFADTLEALRDAYSVSEKGKESSILQISVMHEDPAMAEKILGKISETYLLQNLARNAAEADNSIAFIEAQLPEAEAKMHEAENAVNAYMASQGSIDLTFETQTLLEQTVQLEAQISELDLQEQELKKRYTPAHPVYQTLLDNRAELESRLEALRAQSVDLPEAQLELLRLTRNLEVNREIYLQLVSRVQELQVIKAGTIANIRVIDTPLAAPNPVKPNKMLLVVGATAFALALALGGVLLHALKTRGVESKDEIEALGVSVYGTIQQVGNGDFADKAKGKTTPILAKTEPTSMAVEALRSLRTSLHFGMMDAKSNLLLLTSARPNEGKSFVAVNLATVMAQSGQNLCLVDADIRRGYLRRYFGLPKTAPGLTDVLAGNATLDEVIFKDPDSGLSFIPAGKYPPNPSELLMHKNFSALCAGLDERFEMTLMDAPPLLAVTDPVIIGRYAGMILMVVRHLFTQPGEIAASLKALENNGLKASAAVLNAYSPKAVKQGGSDYSYQYDYKSRA